MDFSIHKSGPVYYAETESPAFVCFIFRSPLYFETTKKVLLWAFHSHFLRSHIKSNPCYIEFDPSQIPNLISYIEFFCAKAFISRVDCTKQTKHELVPRPNLGKSLWCIELSNFFQFRSIPWNIESNIMAILKRLKNHIIIGFSSFLMY